MTTLTRHPLLGQTAPDFTLPSADNEGNLTGIRLSDETGKGPVALLFFPLAFTTVCTAELCMIRDSIKDFEELSASVFGVSVDSPFAQAAFARQQRLAFPLLSDFNRTVSRDYGVLHDQIIGLAEISMRAMFIISPEQVVAFASVCDDPAQIPDIETGKLMLAQSG